MRISRSYRLSEFLDWTRRRLYVALLLSLVPVVLYQLLGQKWVALPWSLAVVLGTAASFIVGFKNAQTYNRAVEAQQVWYPRQYARINTIFVWCFAAVLPFCLVREFDRLNESATGLLAGQMAWLAVPFSALVSWMYVSLDLVGESTESPFEGGANDVPISQISRLIEIELREMPGERDLPQPRRPTNAIIL